MKKIRILSLSDKETSNCLNEVRILASIEHPNIVSYKDSFYDELTSTFCIVTELVEGGDVANLIMKNRAQKTQIK
jgi:NIMA (never in mitosis gene a)-related kinase